MVDQMTRLQLKLLEKVGEVSLQFIERCRSYDGQMDALHRALRRKQDLLQRLREQHMLEDLSRPHTWGGPQRHHQSQFVAAPPPLPTMVPTHIHHPAPVLPFLPPPPPPRIVQQTLPQQPATIIQQLPPQQPLIAQIPPPHPYPAPRSGSIKEDMVELMLMQNAQMHQIIMHNMMLKAMPPMAFSPLGGSIPNLYFQDSYQGTPIFVRQDVKPRGNAVHHHHHYGPTPAGPQLPPISYPTWLPGVSSVPAGQAGGHLSSLHHVSAPITLPPLNV
uniref:Zgc:112416 n=1 Tax=Seriola dumerili TaxID=41447 RepID=A0A3B4ULB6_SERDU